MTIARIKNNGNLQIKDEIIEYPSELNGGRNRFVDHLMLDVDNYELIGPYHYYTINNLSPEEVYTVSVRENFTNDITIPTAGNRALRVNNDKTNSLGVDIIDVRADFGVRTYKRQVNSNEDGKLFIVSFVPDLLPEIYRMVKLEKGNKDTEWTPAPEDLGLKYPDDIQHFSTGFRADGKVMVRELIELDNKFKVNQILENGDFRNGLQGWNFNSVQNDSIMIENGILKFTTDGTVPSTISGNIQFSHPLQIHHQYYAFANVKYAGTMRLKATTYLMEERENNGEWVKLSGLITSNGTFNRPFGIVILDKAPTDVEVKDLFFINLTETFGEGNEPSKDDCDKMFSNYYQNGEYAELINNNAISLKDGIFLVNELIEGVDF